MAQSQRMGQNTAAAFLCIFLSSPSGSFGSRPSDFGLPGCWRENRSPLNPGLHPVAFVAWLSNNEAGAGIAAARLSMPLGKRQRKLLLGLCLGLAIMVLLPLSLPLWFPWVLRPLAAKYGASYASYEREGYSRLALRQVTITNCNVRFRADSIKTLVPTIWLWRSIMHKSSNAQAV